MDPHFERRCFEKVRTTAVLSLAARLPKRLEYLFGDDGFDTDGEERYASRQSCLNNAIRIDQIANPALL